jgi:hypothetical protein
MIASSAVPGPSILPMSYASISRRLAQVTDEIKTAGDARIVILERVGNTSTMAAYSAQTRDHFVAGTP